ncbi:hypothetical protein BDP27DRAFT_1394213 [Rhodocollybia butyracea]|uniref:Uncharacterized protein n=1 Tax=Rhodocollybia butyracea TaxID=206335 RepID=A0A9P5P9X6_9AGAR|nr:hypothetical protein BDP27DRAFT_1394213 [Rhodocollybia butyracea]
MGRSKIHYSISSTILTNSTPYPLTTYNIHPTLNIVGINLTRSANEWTLTELEAYNITVTFQDAQTFFNATPLTAPSIHPEILTAQSAVDTVDKVAYRFLTQLELAMILTDSEAKDSPVVYFAMILFDYLGYLDRPRAARTRKELGLLTCGENKYVMPDVSILDRSLDDDIRLIVQEDKRFPGSLPPHPQLIAKAIAAFQYTNSRRRQAGLEPIGNKVVLGIVMVGTLPTFFKIPVTQELEFGVMTGTFPDTPTVVTGHVPVVPRPHQMFSEGMKPLDNRQAILECYEAFKGFVF